MRLLDRYMISELGGPFLFGLAAFTLLFVAGELLNVARLVSEEHASLLAAAKYFVYTLPQTLVLTFPMSMLLSVLLWIMHRANIARLIGGTESKIGRIVGLADSAPMDRADPVSPVNRRISIIVMTHHMDSTPEGLAVKSQ